MKLERMITKGNIKSLVTVRYKTGGRCDVRIRMYPF